MEPFRGGGAPGEGVPPEWGAVPLHQPAPEVPVHEGFTDKPNHGHDEVASVLARGDVLKLSQLIAERKPMTSLELFHACTMVPTLIAKAAAAYPEQFSNILTGVSENEVRGKEEVLLALVKQGARTDVTDQQGVTVFERFCDLGMTSLVSHLLTAKRTSTELEGAADASKRQRTVEDDSLVPEVPSIDSFPPHYFQGLVHAIQHNVPAVVELYLSQGPWATRTTPEGNSLLSIACESGNLQAVELLIKNGALVNGRDSSGMTPLAAAIKNKQYAVIPCLLERGAAVTLPLYGEFSRTTALHEFAAAGRGDLIELALQHGANINIQNNKGETALAIAAAAGKADAVHMLLQHGADFLMRDLEGRTFLHCLAQGGIVTPELLTRAKQAGIQIDVKNSHGTTALMVAAQHGKSESVQLLLDNGADLVITDRTGQTFLHCLAQGGIVTPELLTRAQQAGIQIDVKNSHGTTALMVAAQHGKSESVQILLQHGADISVRDYNGKTFLHCLAQGGIVTPELLTRAKQAGIDINEKDEWGQTALGCAAMCGKSPSVQLLLDNGADLLITDRSGQTFLHYLAQGGIVTPELLTRAKQAGIDINEKNEGGQTALMHAAAYGKSESVQLLLQHDADISVRDSSRDTFLHCLAQGGIVTPELLTRAKQAGISINENDEWGQTALMHAAECGKSESARILLEHGADTSLLGSKGLAKLYELLEKVGCTDELFKRVIEQGANINAKDNAGLTLMMYAAKDGHFSGVRLLLEAGADPKIKDENGWTLLHYLVQGGASMELITLAIEKGADINAQDDEGWTPLTSAADKSKFECVSTLLQEGADPNIKNKYGWTLLHYLVQGGASMELITLAIDKGADINAQDDEGWTPLISAADESEFDCVCRLLEVGADPNIPDEDGKTLLHYLARGGASVELLMLALQKGANINAQDNEGWTPLISAADESKFDCVCRLLEVGADPNIPDEDGKTLLHYLARGGASVELLMLALQKGANINAQDNEGWTPLIFAADESKFDCVCRLLEVGADPNIADQDGKTLLHYLTWAGASDDCIAVAINRGADIDAQDSLGTTPLAIAAINGYIHTFDYLLQRGARIQNIRIDVLPMVYYVPELKKYQHTIQACIDSFVASTDQEHRLLNKCKKMLTAIPDMQVYSSPVTGAARKKMEGTVIEITSIDELDRVLQVVRKWRQTAKRYQLLTGHIIQAASSEKKAQVNDSVLLQGLIVTALEKMKKRGVVEPHALLIAQDNEVICGIAIIERKKDHVFVDYLATAPRNLGVKVSKRAVMGAGSALLKHIASDAALHHTPVVKLHSASSAESWYKKAGFVDRDGVMVLEVPL